MKKYLVTCTFYTSIEDMMSNKDLIEKQVFVECDPQDIIQKAYSAVKANNYSLKDNVLYHFIITNVIKL